MAPLTWRNVDEPNLSKAADILGSAVKSWSGGMSGFSDAMTGIRDRQRRDRSAAAIPVLAGISSGSDVDAALARVSGMVAPQDMTPELQDALLRARGAGLGYDSTRANTASTVGSNARAQQTHDRNITVENQKAAMAPDLLRMQQEAYAGGLGPANPNLSPEFRAAVPGIWNGESGGDYDALYGYSNREGGAFAGTKLTDMTVDQALAFANPDGEYGKWVAGQNNGTVATPMGAYQVVGGTLADAKKGLGLTGTEKMTPELQDRIGQYIHDTQGTSAWVGYQPSGVYAPDVAGLVPKGNLISPDWLMGVQEGFYNDRRTALKDTRYDEEYRRQEEARVRSEAARDWAWNSMSQFGPNAASEAMDAIANDPSMSPVDKALRMSAMRDMVQNNPEYFAPNATVLADPQDELMRNQMVDQNAVIDDSDLSLRALRASGIAIDGITENPDKALSGEGVPSEVKNENVFGIVEKFRGDTSGYEFYDDKEADVGTINKVAEETGLDPRLVAGAATEAYEEETHLLGLTGTGKLRLNEDKLRQILAPWADPQQRLGLLAERRARIAETENFDKLVKEKQRLGEEINVFGRRSGPDAARRVTAAQEGIAQINGELAKLSGQNNARYSELSPKKAQQKSWADQFLGEGTASDMVSKSSEARRDAILKGASIPSPMGRTVDPEASAFVRSIVEGQRENEIDGILKSINFGLYRQGGSYAVDAALGAVDYFASSPKEAAQNRANRDGVIQAMDWFKSAEAKNLFLSNPALLEAARQDPVGFYQKVASKK